jgi:predicted alpha/beta superfamily hydrolase
MTQAASVVLALVPWLAVMGASATASAQQPTASQPPTASLAETRSHELRSAINGATYLLSISLPVSYGSAPPAAESPRYPTLYLVEPYRAFQVAHQFKASPLMAPDLLLIAIDAADQTPQGQMLHAGMDYTPRDDSSAWAKRARRDGVRFGGADQFLRVLREEIIPWVDSTFRTSGDRGITGHSFGGLFVAYAMMESPDLFTRYAMTSPSLWWNENALMKQEPDFAKRHPVFAKRVFLSIGSHEGAEMAAAMYGFAARLCASYSEGQYKGLDLQVESLPGVEHASAVPLERAMQALYPADAVSAKQRGTAQSCGGGG